MSIYQNIKLVNDDKDIHVIADDTQHEQNDENVYDEDLMVDINKEDHEIANIQSIKVSLQQSTDSFDHYFKYPYLSEEQEKELAHDFLMNGSLKAAHTLVLAHMRYVVKVAKGYLGYGLPLNELVQEGAIGLMKAVKKFNPLQGVRLVSFGIYWIKAEIHEYIIKNWRLVKIATTKAQRKLFFNYRRLKKENFEDLSSRRKQNENIAQALDVSVDEVDLMSLRMKEQEIQLDRPISNESKLTVGDTIPSLQKDPGLLVMEEDNQDYYQHKLPQAFNILNARDQDIIKSRYYNEDKITLKDLADKYAISVERVRQLEKSALDRLKGVLQESE
ncbi:sigma-70 family RNA polymerase sigma factor [bacterium]|jgi:RNA polymerase sigma-32 factor|nr:sigma-70 family RNA polymerase sigma factor [bacterium]NBW57464.1 sigma-70 family RNA polymerase sigma factor [bacterium]NBX72446.1 sigma-70 family RNA polymerase sigma factor [bacterium]